MERYMSRPCLVNNDTGAFHGIIGMRTETVDGVDYHVGDIIAFKEYGVIRKGIISDTNSVKDESIVHADSVKGLVAVKVLPYNLVTTEIIQSALGQPLRIRHFDVFKGTHKEIEDYFEAVIIIEEDAL